MKLKFATTVIRLGSPLRFKNSFPRKSNYILVNRNNSFLDKQLLHSLQQHLGKLIENAKKKIFF